MATHKRGQIRQAVAQDLLGLPTTGDSVYSGRRFRVHRLMLPCLLVYFDDETTETETMVSGAPGRTQSRQGNLVVQGVYRVDQPETADDPLAVDPEAGLDDALDAIALEVEERLYAAAAGTYPGAALEPLVDDWLLLRTEITAGAEGETIYGQIALSFQPYYFTREDQPS